MEPTELFEVPELLEVLPKPPPEPPLEPLETVPEVFATVFLLESAAGFTLLYPAFFAFSTFPSCPTTLPSELTLNPSGVTVSTAKLPSS